MRVRPEGRSACSPRSAVFVYRHQVLPAGWAAAGQVGTNGIPLHLRDSGHKNRSGFAWIVFLVFEISLFIMTEKTQEFNCY